MPGNEYNYEFYIIFLGAFLKLVLMSISLTCSHFFLSFNIFLLTLFSIPLCLGRFVM